MYVFLNEQVDILGNTYFSQQELNQKTVTIISVKFEVKAHSSLTKLSVTTENRGKQSANCLMFNL